MRDSTVHQRLLMKRRRLIRKPLRLKLPKPRSSKRREMPLKDKRLMRNLLLELSRKLLKLMLLPRELLLTNPDLRTLLRPSKQLTKRLTSRLPRRRLLLDKRLLQRLKKRTKQLKRLLLRRLTRSRATITRLLK
jgi:hypothetical protein